MRRLLPFLVLLVLLGFRLGAAEAARPLGVVYANQEAFFDLVYRNEGSAPVSIRRVATGCECITILTHPETVAPGATARISGVYRSAVAGNIHTVVELVGDNAAEPLFAFHITGFVAEKSWLVSASDLLAGPSNQAMLVDVRPAAAFARAHPPRAVNLPAFSVKSQKALRSRSLVLFDEGYAPEALLAQVLVLREQGFENVAVLTGGLASWIRAGGPVEGTEKQAALLATLSPAEFARSNAANPWLCVAVGGPAPVAVPAATVLHVNDVPELVKKLAETTWPVDGGAGFRPVLIVADDPQVAARTEQQLPRNARQQVYYLAGGGTALAAYQQEQAALARHTGQTFAVQTVKSRPVVSGRCGTCSH